MFLLAQLDKVYDPKNEEDDMVERYEEMNRMREHVFNEVDRDRNKVISLKEFLASTNDEKFEQEEGWEVRGGGIPVACVCTSVKCFYYILISALSEK